MENESDAEIKNGCAAEVPEVLTSQVTPTIIPLVSRVMSQMQ